jgi:hypothetical protein
MTTPVVHPYRPRVAAPVPSRLARALVRLPWTWRWRWARAAIGGHWERVVRGTTAHEAAGLLRAPWEPSPSCSRRVVELPPDDGGLGIVRFVIACEDHGARTGQ